MNGVSVTLGKEGDISQMAILNVKGNTDANRSRWKNSYQNILD